MSKATQLWKTVGITDHPGIGIKIRFGTDFVANSKRANKGSTRCDYIELDKESTKVEALEALKAHSDFQSTEDQALISEALGERTREKRVRVSKKSLSIEAIKARANRKNTTAEDVLSAVTE